MEAPHKIGMMVEQKPSPIIKGEVLDVAFDAKTSEFRYKVAFEGGERWFDHSQIIASAVAVAEQQVLGLEDVADATDLLGGQ